MAQEVPHRFDTAYLTIDYDEANHWVYSNWKGYLTIETVQAGAEAILQHLQYHRCAYLLNDNRRVLGMWNPAMEWTITNWAPRAVALGLTYFAHLVQPDAMATLSAEALTLGISKYLCIASFEDTEPAMLCYGYVRHSGPLASKKLPSEAHAGKSFPTRLRTAAPKIVYSSIPHFRHHGPAQPA